ncbi:hypothetical protein HTZ84_13965 [Haloterrigena sp. SYSU A558-1]|uniref:Halobacterial output domain-containing protein n=1 Tax=Haloterrigena gelatinilytica TaxID=2741724 RepID=A0A8J8KE13_9EURY|nr:HalOD1 output domain-containing protein [Haloterrigena gelatinilytica]NUB90778.1 hypothetical protein [Haloterrigena gelatinilytica]NUC73405.1 hypothetical protein [Haloterrigena gelatinilytica]
MSPSNSNFTGDPDPPIHIEQQFDSDTPPSLAIVRAIAAVENVDPVKSPSALGITLSDHIDPSALDQLIGKDSEDSVTIDFTIQNSHQYSVRVQDTNLVIERASE